MCMTIVDTIEQAHPALAYCYERKLTGLTSELAPIFRGKVSALFRIDADSGVVASSKITCSDFHDQELGRCVAQVIKSLHFEHLDELASNQEQIVVAKDFVFDVR